MPYAIDDTKVDNVDHLLAADWNAAAEAINELGYGDYNVRTYGAVGDDTTDDSAEIAAARTAAGIHRPIRLPAGDYNQSATANLYGADFKDALGTQYLLGTAAAPATRHEPVIWLEKISSSNRDVIATAWDQGGIYASLEKTAGNAFGAAITGFAKATGGSGDQVGGHFRGRCDVDGGSVFGAWLYANNQAAAPGRIVGAEIDVQVGASFDHGWDDEAASGSVSGLLIATAIEGRMTHGVRLTKHTGGGFWTGIQFGSDAIIGNTGGSPIQNGEAFHVHGGSSTSLRIGGLRLGTGHFGYGISTAEATIGNNAGVVLADGHRIIWGTGPAAGRHLATVSSGDATLTYTGGAFNLATATAEYRVAGTKVVDARITGWGAPTGTLTRTTFATGSVTLPQLAERVAALITDLTSHGLIGA